MKNEFDAFEQRLSDALQGDEMPQADFVNKVMTRVRETPQKKAKKVTPRFKTWQIAACAAVVAVVAVPVVFMTTMRVGSAAPAAAADCAAPAEGEPAAAEESFTMTAENGMVDYGVTEDSMEAKSKANVNQETVTISDPDVAEAVRAWLEENGYVDDGGYLLSAEEAAQLMENVPQAELPLCTVQLILEAAE